MHQVGETGIGLRLGLNADVWLEFGGLCRVRLGGAGLRDCRRGVVRLDVRLRAGCGIRLGLSGLRRLRWSRAAFGAVGIGALRLYAVRLGVGSRPGFSVGLGGRALRCVRLGSVSLGALRLDIGLRFGCCDRLGFGGF